MGRACSRWIEHQLLPCVFGAAATLAILPFAAATANADMTEVAGSESSRPTVPSWYDAHRVQAHARLPLSRGVPIDQLLVGPDARVHELGASVLVRHIKTAGEAVRWDSPVTGPLRDRIGGAASVLGALVGGATKGGVNLIGYYWLSSDDVQAKAHPEWVCRDHRGRPLRNRRGAWLDITGPYREVIVKNLLVAASEQVKGFYFDYMHLPIDGCWGTQIEAEYRKHYGLASGGDAPRIADDLRWRQFSADRLAATFEYIDSKLRRRHPDVVLIISATTLPALTLPNMSTRLVARNPAKTEFINALRARFVGNAFRGSKTSAPDPDIRIAAGLAVLRDASDGLPPHVWAPQFPDGIHLTGFVSAVIAQGGIANVDVPDELLLDDRALDTPKAKDISAAFELGNKLSASMGGARPLRWAAVHFAESARDLRWPDYEKAWTDVLWPFLGAYGSLVQLGVPVGVVNDAQLAQGLLADYRVLVLTDFDDLSPAQRNAVDTFTRRGGYVIRMDRSARWSDVEHRAASEAGFIKEVRSFIEDAPVQLLDAPSRVHVVPHLPQVGGSRLLIAVTPNFSWVAPVDTKDVRGRYGVPPPDMVRGVRLSVSAQMWRGISPTQIAAVEQVSGRVVPIKVSDGKLEILVPAFREIALLMLEPKAATKPTTGASPP